MLKYPLCAEVPIVLYGEVVDHIFAKSETLQYIQEITEPIGDRKKDFYCMAILIHCRAVRKVFAAGTFLCLKAKELLTLI